MSYQDVSSFAQSWGLVFLMSMFVIAVGYALWPSNKDKFNKAAQSPLDEE
ncbi:cbb3-type cytochrome c oxidase subunit 3 [Pseudemcibacter aquimaris]|nr:cbb3-type cytochrome c oxidase subunit 3 [Pseudemcibacter aquimaris]MCC3862275.1 cbb3-type cytochrome c oxidase subunit 3 [Pseudemcibacter aquimaris]WDU59025.1 cbb3-type cytochrome c oxidase subunit 3 [Pseudemcibacter aquimaris]